jgi:hypothetical protein
MMMMMMMKILTMKFDSDDAGGDIRCRNRQQTWIGTQRADARQQLALIAAIQVRGRSRHPARASRQRATSPNNAMVLAD